MANIPAHQNLPKHAQKDNHSRGVEPVLLYEHMHFLQCTEGYSVSNMDVQWSPRECSQNEEREGEEKGRGRLKRWGEKRFRQSSWASQKNLEEERTAGKEGGGEKPRRITRQEVSRATTYICAGCALHKGNTSTGASFRHQIQTSLPLNKFSWLRLQASQGNHSRESGWEKEAWG